MRMTITQIKYFLAILEYNSFSAAADEMYISQSSLSKQIKALENEIGISLFIRSNNKVWLSAGGKLFLDYAKDFNSSYESMKKRFAALEEDAPSGYVSLGTLPLMADYQITDKLINFQKTSNIQVNITEADQTYILRKLRARKIDLALLRLNYLSPDIYDFYPVCKDNFVFVCSVNQSHMLPDTKTPISVEMLSRFHFITMNKESDLPKICKDYFAEMQIHPHIKLTAGRHLYLLGMVSNDLGVTLLPEHMVNTSMFPNLVTVPLEEPFSTGIGIVRLKNENFSWETDALYSYFCE